MAKIEARIMKALDSLKTGIRKRELRKKLGVSKADENPLAAALDGLLGSAEILYKNGRYYSARVLRLERAEIVKVTNTFGFARLSDDADSGEKRRDVFIPGHKLQGAMPGDIVLIKQRPGSGELPEGEVVSAMAVSDKPFSGVVKKEPDGVYVQPDSYVKYPVRLSRESALGLENGEKILARIISRGERHSGHVADVVESYGNADTAKACCAAILAENGVRLKFPDEVIEQAKKIEAAGIHPKEIAVRLDLRNEAILTIDSADTKDIDDAVSLKKTASGWELGVHIADVSYYVPYKSLIDEEAYARGTSVYYADNVVPMLPKELSNGICSLNPGEDRLTLSAIISLDNNANIKDYRFAKTVIRSRVQGVYSEINAILDATATDEVPAKYKGFENIIRDMAALAENLTQNRYARGGMDLESTESKITVSPEGLAVDVKARERGLSERIIEEFMLVANEAAAALALQKNLPFVYRVHESPSPEKIENLYAVLDSLGIKHGKSGGSVKQSSLAAILTEVRGSALASIVNAMLLRSMAKAKYSHVNIGHYGLSLKNYTHFTSPIRRYPDLTIHRILSGFVTGMKRENIEKRFSAYVPGVSMHSTAREIAAMTAERDCEDCYKSEFMRAFIGEEFNGVVTSVTPFGAYVQLENTVEGLVRLSDFPAGDWVFDGMVAFTSASPTGRIRIGDGLRVRIAGVNVSAGQIDMQTAVK